MEQFEQLVTFLYLHLSSCHSCIRGSIMAASALWLRVPRVFKANVKSLILTIDAPKILALIVQAFPVFIVTNSQWAKHVALMPLKYHQWKALLSIFAYTLRTHI